MRKKVFSKKMPVFLFSLLAGIMCLSPARGYCQEADADGNGTYETATPLLMKKNAAGSLSTEDKTDIYKFEVAKTGYVMISYTSAFRTPQFTIEDANQKYIHSYYVKI